MEKKRKCPYCGALLSNNNSVFIHIIRYTDRGRISKNHWICCDCWADTRIQLPYYKLYQQLPYYKLYQLPDPECTVKIKESKARVCGECTRLIFKDYKRMSGRCSITGLDHNFEDPCTHEEDSDND